MQYHLVVLAGFACAASVSAQPVVDGTRDALYGAPVSVQGVQTQFGDANPNGGSELDAAYARVEGGRLYLLFTGNLEKNFNKFNLFIDSRAGGENQLTGIPQYDGGRSSNFASGPNGMRFDPGFTADFHLFARWGGGANNPFEVDFIDRNGGAPAMVPGSAGAGSNGLLLSSGTITAGTVGPNASGTALSQNLVFAIDGSNVAGVGGGTGPADQTAAAAVLTGMEFSIALADLGNPADGSTIRLAAMIGNGDHNYLSNQVLGSLEAPRGNLGGDGNGGFTGVLAGIDFSQYAGNQYFEVVIPAPGAAGLLAIGGLAALRRRRN